MYATACLAPHNQNDFNFANGTMESYAMQWNYEITRFLFSFSSSTQFARIG
jgi:hypothetical protein